MFTSILLCIYKPMANFMGMQSSSHTGACDQNGIMLDLMCCCHHLEILNNFMFEPVLCQWSLIGWWDIMWRQEIHKRCMSAIFCFPWAQNSGESTRHRSSARLNTHAKWVCDVYNWVSWGADSPKSLCVPFETVYAPNAERKQRCLKKHKLWFFQ